MTPTAQHAAQDALTRLSSALDDLHALPLGTLDRDEVDAAVRSAYRLGNRLDAAKLRLVRAAVDHTTDGTVTDLLATTPVNLSRTHARKDVAAARHTDPHAFGNGDASAANEATAAPSPASARNSPPGTPPWPTSMPTSPPCAPSPPHCAAAPSRSR